jgi:cytochrome c-type biogenesis protein CcmH/NrfG
MVLLVYFGLQIDQATLLQGRGQTLGLLVELLLNLALLATLPLFLTGVVLVALAHSRRQPNGHTVPTQTWSAISATDGPTSPVQRRLEELERLRAAGVLAEREYAEQRARILREL